MATPSIVVVGVGSIGRRHIRNLIALGVDPTDIRAVDILINQINTPDIAGEGIDTVWCGREITDDDIGSPKALLICTPADQHARFIAYAQQRRIPFFVEKPATTDPNAAIDWETDVPHLVGCNLRFRVDVLALKVAAATATSGEFMCIQDMRLWPGRHYTDPLFEFCHEIDLALWMFGPATITDLERVERISRLTLHHANGANSIVRVGDAERAHVRMWKVGDVDPMIRSYVGELPRVNDMYLAEMYHFLRVVRGADDSINTLTDARRVVKICATAIGALA